MKQNNYSNYCVFALPYPHASLSVFLSHGFFQIWQARSAWIFPSFVYKLNLVMRWCLASQRGGAKVESQTETETDSRRERQCDVQRRGRRLRFEGSWKQQDLSPPEGCTWGVWTPALGSQLFKDGHAWHINSRIIRRQGTMRPWRGSISAAALWAEG